MFKALRFGVIATIFSLFISAPVAAGDTGVASLLHTLRGENAMVCMVGHYHTGNSPRAFKSRSAAYKAAINHWVSFTAAEYGSDWGAFSRSANRTSNCEKASRTSWTCKVKSRPCRKGLSLARR